MDGDLDYITVFLAQHVKASHFGVLFTNPEQHAKDLCV
jgi:hypothetical protein